MLRRPLLGRRQRKPARQQVVRDFHRLYYGSPPRTWANTFWLGTRVLKCPLDLWVYQEILAEVKPAVVVEAGTHHGGSALYLASVCDLLGHGQVVTIDVAEFPNRPEHPRITYLLGSSTDPAIIATVDELIGGREPVLVTLDSNHSRDHVLTELNSWHERVSPGSYLIVEDTNVNGHPVKKKHGPGPWEAVNAWLPAHPDFGLDRTREKFFLTFNPHGYLKRASARNDPGLAVTRGRRG